MRRVRSPKTVGRYMCSLKAFAKAWSLEVEVLPEYRLPTPLPSNPHPLDGGFRTVYTLMMECESEQERAMVALCGLCGLRIGEALSVKPQHFHETDQGWSLVIKGKGDRWRRVPVSNAAWALGIEAEYLVAKEANRNLVTFDDRTARKIITGLGVKIEYPRPIASHDLRATFATEVYVKTKDIRVVQELLGHSSVVTTQAYVGIQESKLREAVN